MEIGPTDPTDAGHGERSSITVAGLFGLVVALLLVDLGTDFREGLTARHVAIEGSLIVVALVGAGLMLRRYVAALRRERRLAAESEALAGDLRRARAEAERWRSEARDVLAGLGAAIDRQFEVWDLTPAEKEVALLLLKGLSHREIAAVRSVGEATVRQQAGAVYRKAGLTSRRDLAAFFLEDLLLPAGS